MRLKLEYVIKAPPIQMKLDPKRIRQVMTNLVDNSIQYGSNEIFIEVAQTNKHLIVKVRDDGQGIDEEDIPNIFNPFFRGEKSRTKNKAVDQD